MLFNLTLVQPASYRQMCFHVWVSQEYINVLHLKPAGNT